MEELIKPAIIAPYIISPQTFINTNEFCREAITFAKNGRYTDAPIGTSSYNDYWDEQERRCLEGYTVGGIRVTGEHYGYLNFARIKTTVKEGKKSRKYEGFPRFLDMDYYYFHELEQAMDEGEGIITAKSRQKGFSFKSAWGSAYEYNWHRDSLTIIASFMSDYSEATMGMAINMISFLNKHTDWAKRKLIDTRTHVKAGFKEFIDGIPIDSGFKSEIVSMSFKDNTSKAIGKTARRMLFEEVGKWPGFIDAFQLSKALFYDGEIAIGIPIIQGTGGDMEGGTADFSEMFYNPRAYGLRAYKNVWDDNAVGECGWFVADEWYKSPYIDKEGNSARIIARQANLNRREIVKKSGTKRALDKETTQFPNTPAEAFLRVTGNRFPSADMLARLSKLEADTRISDADFIGELIIDEDGKIEWKLNPKLTPIKTFPLKGDEDTEGCVVIFEHPQTDELEEITHNRYLVGVDPYSQDKSTTESLGSALVYDRLTKRIVAEYTARPETSNEYYEIVRRLILYYNGICLYENQVPGLFQYLEGKNQAYLLMDQPDYIKDIIKDSRVERGKGMHMTQGLKEHGEDLINAWLREPYDTEPDILNLHKIRSIPLLKELIGYNPEGNFDRVISLTCIMYAVQQLRKYRVEETKDTARGILSSDFFNRKIKHKPIIRYRNRF